MTDKVLLTKVGNVGIVTLNSPPVNALSQEIRKGLLDAFSKAESDNSIKAIILMGADRTFSAGADISEFGKSSLEPALPMVCQTIESTSKPVIAAITGASFTGVISKDNSIESAAFNESEACRINELFPNQSKSKLMDNWPS